MLINPNLQELTNRQIPIPWSMEFELLEEEADCWLYQISHREGALSELLITPIPSDLWPYTWEVTITVQEREGILARLAQFMGDRDINILRANSITVDQSRSHVIRIVVDCRSYKSQQDGDRFDRINKPNAKLRGLQRYLEVEFIEEIYFLRPLHPDISVRRNTTLWRAFQEKEERPIRRGKRLPISKGFVELPKKTMNRIMKSYSDHYEIALAKLDTPLGLISFDEYSDLARVFVLYRGLGMIPMIITLDNCPGAIAEATHLLQKNKFNILASRAWSSHDQDRTTAWLLLQDLTVRSLPIEDQKICDKVDAILSDESALSLKKYRPVLFFPFCE